MNQKKNEEDYYASKHKKIIKKNDTKEDSKEFKKQKQPEENQILQTLTPPDSIAVKSISAYT